MAQGSFSAQVSAWAAQTRERMDAIRKESAQRVIEVMQTPVARGGNLPVDTGFLRASLRVTLGDTLAPATAKPDGPGVFTYDPSAVQLTLIASKPTDLITAAYGANYARFQEYGARGRPGRRFVALAAQQWPQIVAQVAAEAKARST